MILAVALALAADLQRVSVVVMNAPTGTKVSAAHDGAPPIAMVDKGIGGLSATFEGPPQRMMQVQILMDLGGQTRRVYDGTETIADVEDDTLSFTYDPMRGVRRVAGAPSAAIPLLRDDDAALRVAMGWGALTLAWVIGMGVVWARRRG